MTNSVLETIRKRRSIRKFDHQEIPKETIKDILTAAFFSPSSSNRRPWHFVLVSDRVLIEKLSKARDGSSSFASGAPLVIVVCADSETAGRWIEDSSIASTLIQLTATELGLGSCWIHIHDTVHSEEQSGEDYVREVLGIPKTIRVLNLIAIGFAAQDKSPHQDDEFMPDRVHWESF
jgi:nitroreductase